MKSYQIECGSVRFAHRPLQFTVSPIGETIQNLSFEWWKIFKINQFKNAVFNKWHLTARMESYQTAYLVNLTLNTNLHNAVYP